MSDIRIINKTVAMSKIDMQTAINVYAEKEKRLWLVPDEEFHEIVLGAANAGVKIDSVIPLIESVLLMALTHGLLKDEKIIDSLLR